VTTDHPPEPTAPEAEPELSLTTKIAIIEGERFSVPADMPVEQIRENLRSVYPGIGTARPTTGTTTIEGVRYETVEFVKQAGTKGLLADAAEPNPLLVLALLPRLPIGPIPAHHHVSLLQRGGLTFDAALDLPLFTGQRSLTCITEHRLCQSLEDAPPVAAGPALTVPGWSASATC
jgi:hypothetical protein